MPNEPRPDLSAMHERADEAARLLKALGNPQRLRVLCLLVEGERSVGEIHKDLPDLSQSALSQHLARLREEGLVRTRREAQSIHYALEPGPARAVIEVLHAAYCRPSRRGAAAIKRGARSG
ncbi:ArsR/SmtB family transcription factor [Frateuria terrea]|uniref:DNA-binding transcriptional regulator, ArsR family n=1 Tax=Frateuria terrea TaxID=529704 RepID=A0A1H6V101_9GAMM|nr:metalloregulator ArsR/SmtB family transcription factor [Frateuria terrea]SEI94320.1 DNA-binding transcriptional regulator, ArsR family [Frateuria terrea]SFP34123.1 DNA-binding transcriptional regulator, ArsR family [Frateuria terrea]